MPAFHTSRRSFLRTIATASGALAFPNILGAQNPGRKLGIACIGVGGKGESDVQFSSTRNEIVALCDVDATTLAKLGSKYPGAKQYRDFRKMLDEMKNIDAVTISTPDHAHYPAAMHAIGHGKHVFIQKPLTNKLWELRELHKAARKKGVITQMGNQGHTIEGNRVLLEMLTAGAIGKVTEIHVWSNRPTWPQGNSAIIKTGQTAPDTLDWPLWLAGTKDTGYSDTIHPFKWRGFLEWGAGAIGDMGCHHLDAPMWALGLGLPQFVTADVEEISDIAWPRGGTVKMEWSNVPKHGPITLTWYEGKKADGTYHLPEWPSQIDMATAFKNGKPSTGGFFIVGSEGVILITTDHCTNPVIWPKQRQDDFFATSLPRFAQRSITPGNPQQEWSEAIKAGAEFPYMSHFDVAAPLTELCLVGGLAMLLGGKRIEWDSEKLEVKGMPEAAKYIKRASYQAGYEYTADKI